MIHFVGAGSGAADLITVRGRKFLEEADVIIYAGSLVNPELLNYAKEACKIYDSAKMTLEEVLDVMRQAEKDGQMTEQSGQKTEKLTKYENPGKEDHHYEIYSNRYRQ